MDGGFDARDTGIKITVLWVLNGDEFADREYGSLKVSKTFEQRVLSQMKEKGENDLNEINDLPKQKDDSKTEETEITAQKHLRNNTIILMKSRKVAWQIGDVKSKVFVIKALFSGP